ncbi:MAG: DNA mismatch repair protein MutS [Bacteroidetes bacterium]|nr:DNA mismatch repair protein MutS [Bacteroidota bacterium]
MNYINKSKETPLMRQYNRIKEKHPGAILLFRVGDFYETFGKDAIKASEILDIVLTKRSNGASSSVELAGFPHHALDNYIPKLINAGCRVAVCDQLEDPKYAKGIVKRGVTELITPGLAYHDNLLKKKSNNFLSSIYLNKKNYGISFLDLSTGEFLTSQGNVNYIKKLLESFDPKEVIFSKKSKKDIIPLLKPHLPHYCLEDWIFEYDYAYEKLTNHFETNSLKGFGIENLKFGIIASGAIIRYLEETVMSGQNDKNIDSDFPAKKNSLKHINSISRINKDKFVWLDQFTIKNLELIYCQNSEGTSLIEIIDKTITAMGARLLRKWLLLPLKDLELINHRIDAVEAFVKNDKIKENILNSLKQISDLERLSAKIGSQRIFPREVITLKNSLKQLKPIKQNLSTIKNLKKLIAELTTLEEIILRIEQTIKEEAPINFNNGEIIKKGIDPELDDYKNIILKSENFLQKLKDNQIKITGINSLKIGYNKIFGYYLEVTNKYKNKVPKEWIRKQTLVNAERYITEELKHYEEKILNAKEKVNSLEQTIYRNLIEDLAFIIKDLQNNAKIISEIDCYLGLSIVAEQNNYIKPNLTNDNILKIEGGRHPVIEQTLSIDKHYVPNDIFLDDKQQQIIIITGPNMAGKSALLRQVALITILAQIGCFVPAHKATIGLVDKIFTRVGASDNISKGESTFMVEMNETASILNNITQKSLIIMDEIGRGTSTYDGISIAKAIVEYLHEHHFKPKTLFATHYHELNEIEGNLERVKNYNVQVKEEKDKVIFIHKLKKGGCRHSFGLNVAKMAGIPDKIINKANFIMNDFLSNKKENTNSENEYQLKLFEVRKIDNKLENSLKKLDIDSLSPIEALIKLNDLKKEIEKIE